MAAAAPIQQVQQIDWSVTEEKVAELVSRIVAAADPLEVIAFGSRARGDHREDSDLDLAVIVEDEAKGREDWVTSRRRQQVSRLASQRVSKSAG